MLPQPTQIFISYARADAQFVDNIVRSVAVLGYQPWIDRQQLAGSQQWSQELGRAIAASRALIVVLTPHSITSPVVAQEYRYALSLGIPVIVIRKGTSLRVPPELAHFPRIDKVRWRSYVSRLYIACRDLGLPTPPPIAGFNSTSSGALYLAFEGHEAPGWRVFRTPASALAWRAVLWFGITLTLWGTNGKLPFFPTNAYSTLLGFISSSISFFTLLYGIVIVLYAMRMIVGELLVLTPEGVSASFLRQQGIALAPKVQTFAYHEVEQLTTRQTWWGHCALRLEGQGQRSTITLPPRLGQRRAILRQAVADWQAARQTAATLPAPPLAPPALVTTLPSTPLTPPPASPVAHPTYTIIGSPADAPLLNELSAWLYQRGIAPLAISQFVPGEGILAPPLASLGASSVIFVVTSDAVLRSPFAQALIADAMRRHQPLIPLRIAPNQPFPGPLGQFQWIDFSGATDRANSYVDLCDALDRLGCIAPPPPGVLDREWVLARAKHQRPLPDWRVYLPVPGMGQTQQQVLPARAFISPWAFPVILAVILVVALYNQLMASDGSFNAALTFILSIFSFIAASVIVSIPMMRRQFRRSRFIMQVAQSAFIPDVIVLMPEGLVIHALAMGTRFIDVTLPLRDVIGAEDKPSIAGPTDLVVTTRQGKQTITLTSFNPSIPALAQDINRFVAAYARVIT